MQGIIYCPHGENVYRCRGCVPPSGDPTARIAIVGARPGRDELPARTPFIGSSGELLWRRLKMPREQVYVTNVRKDYSPDRSVPDQREINEALPGLRDELGACNANVFIALGAQALQALTGKHSIESWRGSVIESSLLPGRKVFATWHPAACLRTFSWRYVLDRDLRRAVNESHYPDIRRPTRTFTINPGLEEAVEYLRSLGDTVSVDIETFGERISCVGLGDSPQRAICIPFIGGKLLVGELATVWREIDRVLRTRRIIGQNIQFDTTRLERLGFHIENIHGDTMLKHHLLWTELGEGTKKKDNRGIDSITGRHKLSFIASIYTEEPFYKDESEMAWTEPGLPIEERYHRYWSYNLKDVCVTYEADEKMDVELEKYGQRTYYDQKVNALIRPIMRMQDRGFCVNWTALRRIKERSGLECDYLQQLLNHAVGFACNVRSTPDMRYLLRDVLHYNTGNLTKGGAMSTDKDTILELAYKSPHTDLFRLILDIRERRTLLEGFTNLETGDNGRYQANILLHGADSGRLSSRARRKGPQLQNLPYPARKMFRPADGMAFIQGDYRRAEAMHVAYDAGDPFLIALFSDESRDLYIETAAESMNFQMQDLLVDGVRTVKCEQIRPVFKQVVLGCNYGMKADRLVKTLRIKGNIYIEDIEITTKYGTRILSNRAKAQYLLDAYMGKAAMLPIWQERVWQEGSTSRRLYDSWGRMRFFLGRLDDHTKNVMLSYRAQASVVGNTNRAIQILDEEGWDVLAQVHDSITIEVPLERVDEGMVALERAMTVEIEVYDGRRVTIPVDLQWSVVSWGEMRPYERPKRELLTSLS